MPPWALSPRTQAHPLSLILRWAFLPRVWCLAPLTSARGAPCCCTSCAQAEQAVVKHAPGTGGARRARRVLVSTAHRPPMLARMAPCTGAALCHNQPPTPCSFKLCVDQPNRCVCAQRMHRQLGRYYQPSRGRWPRQALQQQHITGLAARRRRLTLSSPQRTACTTRVVHFVHFTQLECISCTSSSRHRHAFAPAWLLAAQPWLGSGARPCAAGSAVWGPPRLRAHSFALNALPSGARSPWPPPPRRCLCAPPCNPTPVATTLPTCMSWRPLFSPVA